MASTCLEQSDLFGSLLKLFYLLNAESIFHLAGIRQFASLRLGKVHAIELPSFAGDARDYKRISISTRHFHPCRITSRLIVAILSLRHDAFKAERARPLVHSAAGLKEMIAVFQRAVLRHVCQQFGKNLFAVDERRGSQIEAIYVKEIEHVTDQLANQISSRPARCHIVRAD